MMIWLFLEKLKNGQIDVYKRQEYNVAIENGKAVKTIADLKANDYTVTVKYSGDNNYNAAVAASSFTAVSYTHLHLYKQTLIILKVYLSLLMMSNIGMMKQIILCVYIPV